MQTSATEKLRTMLEKSSKRTFQEILVREVHKESLLVRIVEIDVEIRKARLSHEQLCKAIELIDDEL